MPRKKVVADAERPKSNADRVWLTVERKYRVAEYESLTVSLGVSATIDDGETIGSTTSKAFGELKSEFGDIVEVMRGEEGV